MDRLQPHRRVVDRGTAIGRRRVGAEQQVDADALAASAGWARCSRPRSWSRAGRGAAPWRGAATEPRSLPRRTGSPSARPSWAMVSGWISAVGRCSRLTRGRHLGEAGVEELARRGGDQAVGLLRASARRRSRPCGRAGCGIRWPRGPRAAQSGLKRKRPSGVGKPSRWWAVAEVGQDAPSRRRAWTVSASGQPERASRSSISSHSVMREAGMLGTQRAAPARRCTSGSCGTRRRARRRPCGSGSWGGRRPGRCRRARGTWSPAGRCRPCAAVSVRNCSCTADEQVVAREAAMDLAELRRDAHRVGVLDQQRV